MKYTMYKSYFGFMMQAAEKEASLKYHCNIITQINVRLPQ